MRDNLITLDRALNAANKAGAFTLQEAVAIINAFQAVVQFIGKTEDLSDPTPEPEAPVKKTRKAKA